MTRDLKPFERRYTPEQRKAITFAILDAKPPISVPQAVKRAAAGTLPGWDGPPFGKEQRPDGTWVPMPTKTPYAWKRLELQERGIRAGGRLAKASTSEQAFRTVLAGAWDDLEKARDAARKAKMTPVARMKAVAQTVAAARVIHEAEKTLGQAPGSTKQPPSTEPEKPKPKARNTEADNLARAARKRAQTEHPDALPTTTQHGDRPATGNGHHAEDIANGSDSGARVVTAGLSATHHERVASALGRAS